MYTEAIMVPDFISALAKIREKHGETKSHLEVEMAPQKMLVIPEWFSGRMAIW
jgi:hypothetical protein